MNSASPLIQQPHLSLRDISHRFDHQPALRNLSLDVRAGEVLCLVGPSGCGKSTLLRLIAGLERVQQGSITIDEQVIASASRHLLPEARDIGLVFQDFALFPHLNLHDNVAFGLSRLPRAERHAQALAMLERVGLAERAQDFPHQLSGGQQQRVALARALAPRPRLLLLDEPFSNLDVRLRHRMRLDTLHLLKTSGIASILVTHDPDDAMFMADRIALLRRGELVQFGTPDELYHHPNSPFAAEFFGDINKFSGKVQRGQVSTPFGPVAAAELEEGCQARIMIRPEAIKLNHQGSDARVEARVEESHMLGANALLSLELGEDLPPLQALIASDQLPAVGSQVGLTLDWRGVFVFADTESSTGLDQA